MKNSLDTAPAVREHLVRALEADLIGPFAPEGRELLSLAPSRWYLAGFLAPLEDAAVDARSELDEDDDAGAGEDDPADDGDAAAAEPRGPRLFPSSIGLTVLVPPGEPSDMLEVTVSWADYVRVKPERAEGAGRGRQAAAWERHAREPQVLRVPLDDAALQAGFDVPGSGGLRVQGLVRALRDGAAGHAVGTRAVSVFVVNKRPPADRQAADEAFAFQVGLSIRCARGFVPRARPIPDNDWDAQLDDLLFRDRLDYAVGHGVAAEWTEDAQGVCVHTTWVPRTEVKRIAPARIDGVTLDMETLAATPRDTLRARLLPLVDAYDVWIAGQLAVKLETPLRDETRTELMVRARAARDRIRAGIERLVSDEQAREAFARMNEAMARSARARSPGRYVNSAPSWFPFQLAFVLLNINGICDDAHADRELVDLIFFPTGGGKTEAYLGVIGFTLLLRRLRGAGRPDGGLGTAVILRYTLRLLTLDQLGRAASLCCALELIRRKSPEVWGDARFAVGLWVGAKATANRLKDLDTPLTLWRNGAGNSPLPLESCPWCGTALEARCAQLHPRANPERVEVTCANRSCEFSHTQEGRGLPVLFVDEQIYRELPAFVVATVDKFAMLPWRGQAGALFGKVHSRDRDRFFGPADGSRQPHHTDLPRGLAPPELIVQDELHLISGPLGTMVGLFETAVDTLCAVDAPDGRRRRAKVIASTATVKRARNQIEALFDRKHAVFPPPGISDGDSFFARRVENEPGRLYVGVAAAGRPLKTTLLRSYSALLAASEYTRQPGGTQQPGDAYSTLLGYFNSLRELGGMRRIVEDDVRVRCRSAEQRRPLETSHSPWFRTRDVDADPVELTSRESSGAIVRAKANLEKPWGHSDHVDVALASNMISVGVDIPRLGLMVVAGQPKTAAEYIQATSRVGRDTRSPGLVVTCYNLARPRDRSTFEDFVAFHRSMYRRVEATSVTPFSARAVERGLAAAVVSMVRHLDAMLAPDEGVMAFPERRASAELAATAFERRAGDAGVELGKKVRSLLDRWQRIVATTRADSGKRYYSPLGHPNSRTLLQPSEAVEKNALSDDERAFRAPMSMRDVEPSVHLWIRRYRAGGATHEHGDADGQEDG